jgi:precorrin-3B synthase
MTIRGQCPGVHDPMLSGDGWLVRVKPPAARLPAAAAVALAAASIAGGNGVVQVTQRGNWQFRGFSQSGAADFAALAVAQGVADRDARVERNRRVIAAPLGSVELAREVEACVGGFALADKFCVLVDDADRARLGNWVADVGIRVDSESTRFTIAGAEHGALCQRSEILPTLEKILQAFTDLSDGEGRMGRLLEDSGEAMFFAAAGLQPVGRPAPDAAEPFIGDLGGGVVGIGLPYGQMSAVTLADLAEICARLADGVVRTTPVRAILLAGVADPAGMIRWADGWGLITNPDDARLSITICPGRPSCLSGLADTRAIADVVAREKLSAVHVSGCSKGCAHTGPASITIVGAADGLCVVRDGCAADAPRMSGLAMSDLPEVLAGFVT